jgi:hypothetical protein
MVQLSVRPPAAESVWGCVCQTGQRRPVLLQCTAAPEGAAAAVASNQGFSDRHHGCYEWSEGQHVPFRRHVSVSKLQIWDQ